MKLLTLTNAEDKEPVCINFDQVLYFSELKSSTIIDFHNNSLEVTERLDEILQMLEGVSELS